MSGWNMSDRCKMDRQRTKGFGNGHDRMNHNIVPTYKRKSSFLPGEWKLLVPWKYAFLLIKPVGASRILNSNNSINCVSIERIMDHILSLSYIVLIQYNITLEKKFLLKPTPKITIRKILVIYLSFMQIVANRIIKILIRGQGKYFGL